MTLAVQGSPETGYWVNLGPGEMRLGCIYPTRDQAVAMLKYHRRNCGVHPIESEEPEPKPTPPRQALWSRFRQPRRYSMTDADPSL